MSHFMHVTIRAHLVSLFVYKLAYVLSESESLIAKQGTVAPLSGDTNWRPPSMAYNHTTDQSAQQNKFNLGQLYEKV